MGLPHGLEFVLFNADLKNSQQDLILLACQVFLYSFVCPSGMVYRINWYRTSNSKTSSCV